MALERDFLKKAKRDIKPPSAELRAKVEADDPEDAASLAEMLGNAPEKPAEAQPEPVAPVAPEEPAAAPVEAVSTEKPAPKAKPEKEEGGDKVPVHLMVSERKRADAAEKQMREAEQRLRDAEAKLAEAAKPKVEPKKEPEDPEPDKNLKPIEWSEWKTRELDRRSAQLEQKIKQVDEGLGKITAREQEVQQRQQFSKLTAGIMDAAENGSVPDRIPHIADFKARYEHIRAIQIRQNQINGLDAETAASPDVLDAQLANFIGGQVAAGKNWVQSMSELADTYGYKPKEAEAPAAKTAPAKSAIDRMKDQQARESASRSSATMPGTPPKASSDAAMSADKWMMLSSKERTQYKRANPKFDFNRMMAESEA